MRYELPARLAGVGLLIFQTFSMLYILVAVFTSIRPPELLIAQALENAFHTSRFSLIISDLALLLLTTGLLVGVVRKNIVCATLLLLESIAYVIIGLAGLLTAAGSGISHSTVVVYCIYIGCPLIVALFIGLSIWGRTSRALRLTTVSACVIFAVAVLIPVSSNLSFQSRLGSISGNISYRDGTPVQEEMFVNCQALDPGVFITSGDPVPPYLTVGARGSYLIKNLPAGHYLLWIALPGQYSSQADKVNVTVLRRRTITQDFILD